MVNERKKNQKVGDVDTIIKDKVELKTPKMYSVILINDDYTPMEFVVYVLQKFFKKNQDEATQIMLNVHKNGIGICGVYTLDIAETKATQVNNFSRVNEHPLQCRVQKS